MTISPADIDGLKTPDVLHAYCRAALGAGKQVGRLTFYPCPLYRAAGSAELLLNK